MTAGAAPTRPGASLLVLQTLAHPPSLGGAAVRGSGSVCRGRAGGGTLLRALRSAVPDRRSGTSHGGRPATNIPPARTPAASPLRPLGQVFVRPPGPGSAGRFHRGEAREPHTGRDCQLRLHRPGGD